VVRFIGVGLAILVAAATATATAQTRAPQVDGIDVVRFGVYADTLVERKQNVDSATGHINIVTDVKLLEATDILCARLGVTFGLEFAVTGAPAGSVVALDWITRFPPQGMRTPTRGLIHDSRYATTAAIGITTYRSYAFEEPWEIVPGLWTLEFHHAGRKIGEKSFTIQTSCPIS
jgi:Domain of unknown function (DUF3859)